MTIHFEITPYWIAFWCHVLGLLCAWLSGGFVGSARSESKDFESGILLVIVAIAFTTCGAHK